MTHPEGAHTTSEFCKRIERPGKFATHMVHGKILASAFAHRRAMQRIVALDARR
jgi:hypothetical protein